jgi:hypothetical protein
VFKRVGFEHFFGNGKITKKKKPGLPRYLRLKTYIWRRLWLDGYLRTVYPWIYFFFFNFDNTLNLRQFYIQKHFLDYLYPQFKMMYVYLCFVIVGICIFFLNFFVFFNNICGCSQASMNSEYNWNRFRDAKDKNLKWVFMDINKHVKRFLSDKNFIGGKEFNRLLQTDEGFTDFFVELAQNKEQKKMSYDHVNKFTFDEKWRPMWLESFLYKLEERDLERLFNKKYDFSYFLFNPKCKSYYENYINEHVFFIGFILYGWKRSQFIEDAFENEAELLTIAPFDNKNSLMFSNLFKKFFKLFYNIDKFLFNHQLPYWVFHKELFTYQVVSTKDVFFESNEELSEEDLASIKYFLVDHPTLIFMGLVFWFLVLPVWFLKINNFVFFRKSAKARHELSFYLFWILGRFSVFGYYFDYIIGTYWDNVSGRKRKISYRSHSRVKKKRWKHMMQVKFFLGSMYYGPFMFNKVRYKKHFVIYSSIWLIYKYILSVLIYFVFSSILIYFIFKMHLNQIFVSKSLNFFFKSPLKEFWRLMIYMNQKNKIKLCNLGFLKKI